MKMTNSYEENQKIAADMRYHLFLCDYQGSWYGTRYTTISMTYVQKHSFTNLTFHHCRYAYFYDA
jgi:hypothetical protein